MKARRQQAALRARASLRRDDAPRAAGSRAAGKDEARRRQVSAVSISPFFGLDMALRALQAQQTGIDVTSHNVANANTDGYSRQNVTIVTTEPFAPPGMNRPATAGQIGTGVRRHRHPARPRHVPGLAVARRGRIGLANAVESVGCAGAGRGGPGRAAGRRAGRPVQRVLPGLERAVERPERERAARPHDGGAAVALADDGDQPHLRPARERPRRPEQRDHHRRRRSERPDGPDPRSERHDRPDRADRAGRERPPRPPRLADGPPVAAGPGEQPTRTRTARST